MAMASNLKKKAKQLKKHGRRGDTMLAHITPQEAKLLKDMGGSGTKNPKTGLPEFYDSTTGNDVADPGNPTGGDYGGGGSTDSINDAIAAGYGPEGPGWGAPMQSGFMDSLGDRMTSPGVMSAAGSLLGSTLSPMAGPVGSVLGAVLSGQMNAKNEPGAVMSALGAMSPVAGLGMGLNAIAQALGATPSPPGQVEAETGFADFNAGPDSGMAMQPGGGNMQTATSTMANMAQPQWARDQLYGGMRFAKGGFINKLADAGRRGDDHLMHVSKSEIKDLNRLVPGGLTRNPETGLPEAFKLKDILRYAAPAAAFALPVAGEALFGGTPGGFVADLLGFGGSKAAGGIGDAVIGGLIGLAGGDPLGGAMAGVGGNLARGDIMDFFAPSTNANLGGAWNGPEGTYGPGGRPFATPQATPANRSWFDRNSGLVGAGLGALALAGAGSPGGDDNKDNQTPQARSLPPGFNDPLISYQFNRNQINPNYDWYRLGRVPQPLQFFDNPAGSYTRMAKGGSVGPSPKSMFKQKHRPTTTEGRKKRSVMNMLAGPSRGGPSMIPGRSGGQDDDVPILASSGEYVIDATTVADLGDGNPAAGAKKLDQMRKNVAKHKGRSKVVPNKAKPVEKYMGVKDGRK